MFEISRAKAEVLRHLVDRDWTPTELAEELDKSTATVYNHLDDLAERGLLSRSQVPAKTRPKTEYSIGDGLVHWLVVLPGLYRESGLALDPHKAVVVRIWTLPQTRFHPYIEAYWWDLRRSSALDVDRDLRALAVYGSVARGHADDQSDIDVLLVVADHVDAPELRREVGAVKVDIPDGSRMAMAELYTTDAYRTAVAGESDFLDAIRDELHVLYDPEGLLTATPAIVDGAN